MPLCKKCQAYFDDVCLKINSQAERMKRGGMIQDALADVMRSIDDGNINAIIERDKKWRAGKRSKRRLDTRQKI